MTVSPQEADAAFGDILDRRSTFEKTIAEILREVAEYAEVNVSDLIGYNRDPYLVRCRQLAVYKARKAGLTYAAIGQYMNRDHTTIISAHSSFKKRLAARKAQENRAAQDGLRAAYWAKEPTE